jgi:phosphoribosyl-dephospho-CoA transferase
MTPRFRRHDLAWLGPRWRQALLAPLAPADEEALAAWVDRGLPTVICRRAAGAPARAVSLGVALPGPGRRLGLLVGTEAVARHAGPVALRDAIPSAPPAWHDRLRSLDVALGGEGISAAVFGSLAWQHLVGETYLRPASDVDLLVALPDPASPWAVVERLAEHDGVSPRLDGELLLGGWRAVAWRELAARPARLLLKSIDGVTLLPLGEALGLPDRAVA